MNKTVSRSKTGSYSKDLVSCVLWKDWDILYIYIHIHQIPLNMHQIMKANILNQSSKSITTHNHQNQSKIHQHQSNMNQSPSKLTNRYYNHLKLQRKSINDQLKSTSINSTSVKTQTIPQESIQDPWVIEQNPFGIHQNLSHSIKFHLLNIYIAMENHGKSASLRTINQPFQQGHVQQQTVTNYQRVHH